ATSACCRRRIVSRRSRPSRRSASRATWAVDAPSVKHSWTGGQYSAWRALFGIALALDAVCGCEGWVGRAAKIVLCVVIAASTPGSWPAAGMLLLHAATHGSPYGSFDARGRADPGGSWILPRWNLA